MYTKGDIYLISGVNDFDGKPRPAIIIQNRLFNQHPSVTIMPITSSIIQNVPDIRLDLMPTSKNGLSKISQAQIDKISTLRVNKIAKKIGALEHKELKELNQKIKFWLDL